MQSDKLSAQRKSAMVQKALSLLKDGVIDRVLGWKRGEFVYDVTPGVFHSPEELESEFVYDDFCGANLSKYLIAETKKPGRVLVFLKPCDSYSLNQLLTEHRVAREKVYAVAISCDGMTDADLLAKAAGDGILSVRREDDCLFVETLSDEHRSVERKSVLQERCLCCKKKAMIYDELLSEDAACAAPALRRQPL